MYQQSKFHNFKKPLFPTHIFDVNDFKSLCSKLGILNIKDFFENEIDAQHPGAAEKMFGVGN